MPIETVKFPINIKWLFVRIEKNNHNWYLECQTTHGYLMASRYSEFIRPYHLGLHMSVHPVTFVNEQDAIDHVKHFTHPKYSNLKPRPIADFFLQYILGEFVPFGRVNFDLEGMSGMNTLHNRK